MIKVSLVTNAKYKILVFDLKVQRSSNDSTLDSSFYFTRVVLFYVQQVCSQFSDMESFLHHIIARTWFLCSYRMFSYYDTFWLLDVNIPDLCILFTVATHVRYRSVRVPCFCLLLFDNSSNDLRLYDIFLILTYKIYRRRLAAKNWDTL